MKAAGPEQKPEKPPFLDQIPDPQMGTVFGSRFGNRGGTLLLITVRVVPRTRFGAGFWFQKVVRTFGSRVRPFLRPSVRVPSPPCRAEFSRPK